MAQPTPTLADLLAHYRTLPEREIRKRQSLCDMQQRTAYEHRNEPAMRNLAVMSDALMAAMLERC